MSSVTYFIRHLSRTTPKSCDFITQLMPVKLLVKIQFKSRFRAICTRIVFRELQFAEFQTRTNGGKFNKVSLCSMYLICFTVKITDSKYV